MPDSQIPTVNICFSCHLCAIHGVLRGLLTFTNVSSPKYKQSAEFNSMYCQSKSRQKKLVKWNESISRNNFLDNFHFLNFQQNIQKQLREIDLFDFTSFLALDILKF